MALIQKRIPHLRKPDGPVNVGFGGIARGLTAFWLSNEGVGAPRDLITNVSGSLGGDVLWSIEPQGQGRVLDLDGTGDSVDTNLSSSEFSVPNSSSNITVCFRIFPRNLGGAAGSFSEARIIIAKTAAAGGTASDYEWAVGIEGGTIFVRTSGGNGGALGSLTINQWHDVIVTYEGGVGHTVYINKAKSFGSNTDLSPHNSSWNIVFGRAVYGVFYDGFIHDVRIYNRLLTDAEAERYTDYPYEILKPRHRRVPFSAATGTTFNQAVAGSITSTGALTFITSFKQTLTGSISATGTLARKISTSVEGSITATGSVIKNTSRVLAGSITAAGALASELSSDVLKTVTGSITATGALTKKVFRSLSGSVSSTGAITKKTSIDLDGSIGMSGDPDKGMSQDTSGSITPTGTLTASDPFVPAPDEDEAGSGSFAQRLRRIYGTVTRYRR